MKKNTKNRVEKKNPTLWTKNFTLITISTILSAIGGEAMNLPISLLVFDYTQSTLLSSIILVCGMLPDIVLPVLIAPIIDKTKKKMWLLITDGALVLVYLAMGIWTMVFDFYYVLYVIFTLVVGTISVISRLSYNAWYPDLIPVGMEQKGYAVSGTIYPVIIIAMAPITTVLYEYVSISQIFLFVAILTLISFVLESRILEGDTHSHRSITIKDYMKELKEGFIYIKKEKGIRNIYTYMSITSGAGEGVSIMTQAYYQTQPIFTVVMLGFLKSVEMIGRVIGGTLQYKKEIPVKKRYLFTKFVYSFYNVMDSILLFLPYPLMLVNRFLCGALGSTSATIREVAVQSYLSADMRARVQALFQVIFAIGGILFQLAAGILGTYLPYRAVTVLLSGVSMIAMILLIVIPKKENRIVYEATRKI